MGTESNRQVVRYAFAVMAIVGLIAVLWADARRDSQRIGELRAAILSAHQDSQRSLGQMETKLAALDLHVEELESRLGSLRTRLDAQPPPEPAAPPIERPDLEPSIAPQGAEPEPEIEPGNEKQNQARAALFGALDTDSEAFVRMSEVQANAQVDLIYNDLFAELALPADAAAAVRQVLVNATLDEMRAGIENMRAGKMPTAEEINAARDIREDQLRRDLSSILTPEEFARWEQYADTKPARMLASHYDMQLNSLASGLSLEDRQLARDVLVEETLLLQGDGADPFAGFADPETTVQTQAQILDNAANRLATVFDAEQMRRFQTFADYQLSMMESAARFVQ